MCSLNEGENLKDMESSRIMIHVRDSDEDRKAEKAAPVPSSSM